MIDMLLTVGGLVALVIGAEVMIRGAVDIAFRARISPLVVGLTVVSMGTSAPELLVSLIAAMKGSSAIAIGNVVGSNIVNISFILGICVVIFPIEVDRDARRIHWPVMMAVSIAFWYLLSDDRFSRGEGLFYFLLLVAYVGWMVVSSRRASARSDAPSAAPARYPLWRSLLMLAVGILGLAKGADWFVEGAVGISREMGVSEQLIGVTVVAVGTSLPELVTSLLAAMRKQADISLGNLIGSNIFNLLGIIGIASMLEPIELDRSGFALDIMAMLVVCLALYPLMRLGDKIGRWQGAVLVLAYVAFVVLVLQRG
jgi:cation:H+ antiporter